MNFLNKIFGQEAQDLPQDFDDVQPHDVRVAACALLLEMANIDNEFTASEKEMILSILKDEYELSEEYAKELAEAADEEREESLDLWHFTQQINQNFSGDEKIRIVELLWKIVYVDGKLDSHEDYLVHSLANMLNLSHKDLIDAKLKILHGQAE